MRILHTAANLIHLTTLTTITVARPGQRYIEHENDYTELEEMENVFGGIGTFAHLPHVQCVKNASAEFDIAFFGFPFDTGWVSGEKVGGTCIQSRFLSFRCSCQLPTGSSIRSNGYSWRISSNDTGGRIQYTTGSKPSGQLGYSGRLRRCLHHASSILITFRVRRMSANTLLFRMQTVWQCRGFIADAASIWTGAVSITSRPEPR